MSSLALIVDPCNGAFERNNVIAVMEAAGWQVSGSKGAAALLGIKPSTLASRLRSLRIPQPERTSLYRRLGGRSHISAFCRDLLGRMLADPLVGRFWHQRSNAGIDREERLVTDFVCAVAGGPYAYGGAEITPAHAHLHVTSSDWRAFLGHFDDGCRTVGFAPEAAFDLRVMVEGLRGDIVTAGPAAA